MDEDLYIDGSIRLMACHGLMGSWQKKYGIASIRRELKDLLFQSRLFFLFFLCNAQPLDEKPTFKLDHVLVIFLLSPPHRPPVPPATPPINHHRCADLPTLNAHPTTSSSASPPPPAGTCHPVILPCLSQWSPWAASLAVNQWRRTKKKFKVWQSLLRGKTINYLPTRLSE